jgi:hypothetical protein
MDISDYRRCTSLTKKNRCVPLRVARVWHAHPDQTSLAPESHEERRVEVADSMKFVFSFAQALTPD